jgi:hypothetical protein
MFSGNWNNGVYCGPRTVNLNNYSWNVNTNIGARLACDNSFIDLIKEGIKDYGLYSVMFIKRIVRLIILSLSGKSTFLVRLRAHKFLYRGMCC